MISSKNCVSFFEDYFCLSKRCRPEKLHLSGSLFFAKVHSLQSISGFISGLNMCLNLSMLESLIKFVVVCCLFLVVFFFPNNLGPIYSKF